MKYNWNNPLLFGDSYWVRKDEVEALVKSVQALLKNIGEFDTVTDGEFLDAVENALEKLTK